MWSLPSRRRQSGGQGERWTQKPLRGINGLAEGLRRLGQHTGVLRACRSSGEGEERKTSWPGTRTRLQMSRVSGKQTEKGWGSLPGRERRTGESPNARDDTCPLDGYRRVGGYARAAGGKYTQAEPGHEEKESCKVCDRHTEQAVLTGYNYKMFFCFPLTLKIHGYRL